ncbi:putative cell wall-binding protein/Ca2+-binding RTX toxin-like protein [Arthrobacter stackebrandtii]|uniref:Cell wall-binding protein/Ca2+-binding RTX toxin-like protein n=1 Tax=Arthrobacter stackebrandtii TaxID=272161 RepID=A0ABS4YZ29_9MICC|nr:peroxidase family protein [Arthrobacter stackebrandtii]MBP2414052.1 putative cell wall-binding protein/Ca2+-binding RTX toxin-like protein [Arthrobacter stackebrandtii]
MPGQDGYGTAQEVFPRLLEARYRPAEVTPPFAPGNDSAQPGAQTSYEQTDGFVYDSEPRSISNLIVDQTLANPAAGAVAARVEGAGREPGGATARLFGATSTATSAEISQANFPANVGTVVVARVNHYSDALTVSAIAKAAGAPVLLINTNSIPAESAAELTRLSPDKIIIAGGPSAISAAVATKLEAYAPGGVTRIAGANSYATAVEISKYAHPNPATDNPLGTLYVVTGQRFQDALAIAGPAARDNSPVLLVQQNAIPPVVLAEIQRLAPKKIVILGGPLAVSADVQTTLSKSWPTERIGGANSAETAALISAANFGPPVDTVYLSTNANFPDALSIASVAGAKGSPVLLVPKDGTLPAVVQAELKRLQPANIVILGGNIAIQAPLDAAVAPLTLGANFQIPDIATDEGLSASATSLFTIFGQFFDHGLDLVSKGGNGTVVIPLKPDDPLYVDGAQTNFLTLTRATIDTTDGQREHVNRTTPFVDQNQTYGSHASHQAFMREYILDANGWPVPTGKILNGTTGGGLPTWKDIKDQALNVLGIRMNDFDVLDVPLLATDPYGSLIRDGNGQAQLAFEAGLKSGNRAEPLSTEGSLTANASFLDDIAHGATPVAPTISESGVVIPGYDNAALDAHYITGDGRGNENIGLTSVHHVFHSEHNRVLDQVKDELENNMPPELLARYQAGGFWNYGERLFQAARFLTEMEYQHLVFEEFARRVVPTIDPVVLNENSYQPNVNSSINAEFAHAVYRFGHSMLRESVPRMHGTTVTEMPLLDAFLNPTAFANGPDGAPMSASDSAGGILKGLANQTANGVDEFVTDTLRNKLLGLPLDLPAINLARARDAGVPPLQTARTTFYTESGDSQLKPYASWEDFRLSMKNPESIGNFLAAYANHPSVADATTFDAKRAAGQVLAADVGFMNAPAADTGVNDIDLWMGGMAEKPYIFGGMLGSTFNYVFEQQLEDLQNGDRFYYLTRNLGNTLFHSLEANSLSQIVLRNTSADRVPHDVFASPQLTFNLDAAQADLNAAGLTGDAASGWRFTGPEHVVIQDTEASSTIRGGLGDDSIWGKAGNDRIEGDDGVDSLMGGDGDDILTDLFGDGDRLQGEAGNDVMNPGPGVADITFGGSGIDYMMGGQDRVTAHGGLGDDFLIGSTGPDILYGDEGNDWLEGLGGADLVQGDMGNTMFNDANLYHGGHDVLIGNGGNNDLDAEGGDDIMVAGPGTDRYSGVLGFDWVTHKGHTTPVNADMGFIVGMPQDLTAIRDRFLQTEATSGWDGNDIIRGSQGGIDLTFDPSGGAIGYGHDLTQAHLDRINGLRELLGGGDIPIYARPFLQDDPVAFDGDFNNNILLGGMGSDLLEPRDGRNFVDGDAWLNVRIEYRPANGGPVESQDSMAAFNTRMLDGTINPSELHIVREVLQLENQANNIDTAVFEGIAGDYTLTELEPNVVKVVNTLEGEEMSNVLRNIERIQFNDKAVCLPLGTEANCGQAAGDVLLQHDDPIAEDGTLTTDASGVSDADGIDSVLTYSLQSFVEAGTDPFSNAWVTTQTNETGIFTLTDAEVGAPVRVQVTYIDGLGTHEQIASAGTAAVANVNDAPVGAVIAPLAPQVGDILRITTHMSDADGAESVLEEPGGVYTWQQSPDGTEWSDIPGATGDGTNMASFTVTAGQQDNHVRLAIAYTDDLGTNEVAYSNATELVPSPNNPLPAP